MVDKLDPQVRHVYAEYGCTMGEAQLLERYLVYMVLAVHDGPRTESLPSEEYDAMLAKLSKDTLGYLIQKFKRSFDVPADFEIRLANAQHLRNWLAHHYFHDRVEAFQTETGRTAMIRELEDIGDRLHRLWEYFDELLVSWLSDRVSSSKELLERIRGAATEA